jgi:hypothetical protein
MKRMTDERFGDLNNKAEWTHQDTVDACVELSRLRAREARLEAALREVQDVARHSSAGVAHEAFAIARRALEGAE